MATPTTGSHPVAPESSGAAPLLEVDGLYVEFRTRGGTIYAVNGMSYTLAAGETLAILGESGSGKSVGAQAVMGILDVPPARVTAGAVRFRGRDLLALRERERRQTRGRHIAMVFQDALSALNPVFTVGDQISEMFRTHLGVSRREARRRAVELMELVRIPEAARRVNDYPHQFSGGMRQRVMIAMALALEPDVLIADEPTTALDVTVQAQIMKLLADLQAELSMGLVLITHDLGVVADVADRIIVMYAGEVVETAGVTDLYAAPAHPYTEGLLASVPRLDRKSWGLQPIAGSPPDLARLPSGCTFHPRCPRARDRCASDKPALRDLTGDAADAADAGDAAGAAGGGHASACHFAEEVLHGERPR